MKKILYYFEESDDLTGGTQYFNDLLRSLEDDITFKVINIKHKFNRLKLLQRYIKFILVRENTDAHYILNYLPIFFSRNRKFLSNSITIFHHYDPSQQIEHKKLYDYLFRQYFSKLKLIHTVVVVSEYWKKYLESYEVSNVKVIYNPIDTNHLDIVVNTAKNNDKIKTQFGLDISKKIVYIGPSKKNKGTEKVYKMLKHSNYSLVTTGPNTLKLPIRNFNLGYDDYLKLLKICDVIIAMSEFNEGWNRIAAEAMYMRVPVVGARKGGLEELLTKGNQLICDDVGNIEDLIEIAVANKTKLGNKGHNFVKQFDYKYFKKEWLSLIENLLGEPTNC